MEFSTKHFRKRDAILTCLRQTKVHPSADWVYNQLKPEIPDLSLGTVYRNLSLFKEQGLINSLEPFHGEQVCLYAKEILAMIPEDYRARAALCLAEAAKGHTLALRRLLEGRPECSEEEFLEWFPFLLARCEYRELMALEGAVVRHVSAENQNACEAAIDARKDEIRCKSDCYADIPRDVFICHSGMDHAKAIQVMETLEKDGNQCC